MFNRYIRVFLISLVLFGVLPLVAFAQDGGDASANQPIAAAQI